MKYKHLFKIISTLLIVSLMAISLFATPAFAVTDDEEIEIDPEYGEIGDEVEVTGSDFEESYYYSSEEYEYYYIDVFFSDEEADVGDDIDDDVENYEEVASSEEIDDDGEFETDFDVPDELSDGEDDVDVTSGTYYVYVTYANDEEIVAMAEFEVISALIEIDPDEGIVGEEVTIEGTEFNDEEDIEVEFDGDSVDIESGDEETDDDGEFECTIIIPESTVGEHTITVTDDADASAEATFTIEPAVTASAEEGAPGDAIQVQGTGFAGNASVGIQFGSYNLFSGDTDSDGSFTISFKIPDGSTGSFYMEIEDEDGNDAELYFTVAASLELSKTSGNAGEEVTLYGTGFTANRTITLTINNQSVGTAEADGSGAFSTTFALPSMNKGSYTLKATDGSIIATTSVSILTSVDITPVTSASSPGNAGSAVQVSGVGFSAGQQVTVSFDNVKVASGSVSSDGSFAVSFKVPSTQSGEHTIKASDGTNSAEFAYYVESTAPQAPQIVAPLADEKVSSQATFDWSDVSDNSMPVTYTFQIATDSSFSSVGYEQKGLTQSEYTFTGDSALAKTGSDAPYYWRVKAVDAASNSSAWTAATPFAVGMSLNLPDWAKYVLYVIGGILVLLVGFFIGMRSRSRFYM